MSVSKDETVFLRKILRKNWAGLAVYLKQSLDNIHQLTGIVEQVRDNKVAIDPALEDQLLPEKNTSMFLKSLTDREVETLGLLARGYTNYSIAQKLFIDVKTVEHHLNSIYGKIKEDADFTEKHPRVSVARLYLQTTGELLPTKNE